MDRKECQLHLALCEFIDILGSQIGLWEVGEKKMTVNGILFPKLS